jgi:hypothetical protein
MNNNGGIEMKKVLSILIFFMLFASWAVRAENALVKNGDFEEVQNGKPISWALSRRLGKEKQTIILDDKNAYNGKYAVRISQSSQDSYNAIVQNVKVEPEQDYILTAYVRAENIKVKQGGIGALVFVGYDKGRTLSYGKIVDDGEWHQVAVNFNSKTNQIIEIHLYLHQASGTVWFDKVELQKVE